MACFKLVIGFILVYLNSRIGFPIIEKLGPHLGCSTFCSAISSPWSASHISCRGCWLASPGINSHSEMFQARISPLPEQVAAAFKTFVYFFSWLGFICNIIQIFRTYSTCNLLRNAPLRMRKEFDRYAKVLVRLAHWSSPLTCSLLENMLTRAVPSL